MPSAKEADTTFLAGMGLPIAVKGITLAMRATDVFGVVVTHFPTGQLLQVINPCLMVYRKNSL